jgi:DNA-directed RNA polymerase II subunit RPB2
VLGNAPPLLWIWVLADDIVALQQGALDQIGRRGNVGQNAKDKRIRHAEDILTKETLPHISTEKRGHKSKAYFFGYMIHRLILAKLERRDLDDRDHFGKKRLDLAGPLLANLFRLLFRKFTKDIFRHLQKVNIVSLIGLLNLLTHLVHPALVR